MAAGTAKRRLAFIEQKTKDTTLSKQRGTNSGRKVHKGNTGTPTRTNTTLTPTKPAEPHSGQKVGKRKIIAIPQ